MAHAVEGHSRHTDRKLLHVQGWGNILNLAVLLFFLAVQGQTGPQYSFQALSVTWRMQYALGLLPIMYMLAYRIFYLKESTVWQVLFQDLLSSVLGP